MRVVVTETAGDEFIDGRLEAVFLVDLKPRVKVFTRGVGGEHNLFAVLIVIVFRGNALACVGPEHMIKTVDSHFDILGIGVYIIARFVEQLGMLENFGICPSLAECA